eukprot:SAG11_NODE_2354_length_3476_cov_1.793012_2_plen_46_part_00
MIGSYDLATQDIAVDDDPHPSLHRYSVILGRHLQVKGDGEHEEFW